MNQNYLSKLFSKTETIKIYDKTYKLPVLVSRDFWQLQKTIQRRQQLFKEGKGFSSQNFKLFIGGKNVSFEEQFIELEKLLTDYEKIIQLINNYQKKYQFFFVSLAENIKTIVNTKLAELYQAEKERLELESKFKDDEYLGLILKTQKKQIFKNSFILYRSAKLMLKKIDLISKSLQKIAEDQNLQIQSLKVIVDDLSSYYKIYTLQKKIDKIETNIQKLTDIAINFEQSLNECLNPLQWLINRVVKIDKEVLIIVEQIKILAEDILVKEPKISNFDESETFSKSLIDFLFKSQEKKERIREAIKEIQIETIFSLDQFILPETLLKETSLTNTLNLIQIDIDSKLNNFSLSIKPEIASQLAQDYHRLGLNYYFQKDYDKALINLNQAINVNPLYVNAYYHRGLAYYQLKDYNKAIEDYNKALVLNPQSTHAYNGRGFAYYELKEYQKAIKDYNKALIINPQFIYAYYNRGLAYHQLKEYPKAIEDYKQALALNTLENDQLKFLCRGKIEELTFLF